MIKRKAKYPVLRKLKPFFKGTAAALIVTALLTMLFSLIISSLGAKEGAYDGISLVAVGIGCVAGGVLIGGGKERNGFFWGAVGGLILFLIYAVGALIIGNANGDMLFPKLICCVLCSTVGGIIGVNIELNR